MSFRFGRGGWASQLNVPQEILCKTMRRRSYAKIFHFVVIKCGYIFFTSNNCFAMNRGLFSGRISLLSQKLEDDRLIMIVMMKSGRRGR